MDNETSERVGVLHSKDLLAFANTRHLTDIIEKNWEKFAPVFKDETRAKVSFQAINSYRNTVSHNRDLRPFERDLLSGISGQIRNLVTLHLNTLSDTRTHYPVIESAVDSIGNVGIVDPLSYAVQGKFQHAFEVGDVVSFDVSGWDPRDRRLTWELATGDSTYIRPTPELHGLQGYVEPPSGNSVTLNMTMTEEHVGVLLFVGVFLRNESRFRKVTNGSVSWDDMRYFIYRVNPPV
jgi:hypothetical protein